MSLICWLRGHREAPVITQPADKPALIAGALNISTQASLTTSSTMKIIDEHRKLEARTMFCDRCMRLVWIVSPKEGHPKFNSVWIKPKTLYVDPAKELQHYTKKNNKFVSLWLRIIGASRFEKQLIKDLLEKDLKDG